MASSLPSSTQGSDNISSHSVSDHGPSTSTFTSYRELSGSDILIETQQLHSQGIYYAANENLASQCEFIFNKDIKGEMLVPKDPDKKNSEFILTGILEIDAKNFFMTSDGKWNSNNALGTRLDQVKPSCHLLPVQRDDEFSFSTNDYSTILTNIRSIENLANPRKSRDTHSAIIENPGQTSTIRLTHHLFVVCFFRFHFFSFSSFF